MAINVKFDLTNNPEPSTIILARRNGDRLGKLDVNPESISLSDKFNNTSEISFTLNKYKDGELTNLWNEVVDFKLVECKEWNTWFEIRVELDEETETVKTVFCTQLGQAELSQIKLYDMHINDEDDIAREDYKKTILFNEEDTEASLLHRIFKDKAPHYSITHVDDTIAGIQRVFSFDDTDIHGACMEIGEEIGCLFIFPSDSDENGKIQRTVEVYDLQQNCQNSECGYRGEFTDECPKCGSKDIEYGYGVDTPIFVTAEELAEGGIQFTTDTDSIKNCFKLEAGDDSMTATIRNCNPNGTDYIWYFSDAVKSDMSEELQQKIKDYDEEYKEYYNNYESKLNLDLVEKYNILVDKYKDFYNAKRSTCLSCGHKGDFDDSCPESDCQSKNILVGAKLEYIPESFKGFPALMNGYYDTIDFALYLESSLMPSVEIAETDAEEQAALLTKDSLSPVSVASLKNISLYSADNAVLGMAKVIVRSTFDVKIKESNLDKDTNLWSGTFTVTNLSDETDKKDTIRIENVSIDENLESFIKQKIDKALDNKDNEDTTISGLFKKEYIDDCNKICENCEKKDNCFQYELTKYGLHPLEGIHKSCEGCLSILIEQGVGSKDNKNNDSNDDSSDSLYDKLYLPYYNKLKAIETEIALRTSELGIVEGIYEKNENGDKTSLIEAGLQTEIINHRDTIQTNLNFEKYLGEDLWFEFCSYRREDTYSNDNYVSDGLDNNTDLFKRAMEFIDKAESEIYKSGELQHSISTSLKNLLAIPKFKSLVKHFNVGNWIRVQVDDEIYRLRLLEYEIDFGDFDSIPVTFSDVTKIKSGITDVQDILAQASSMATSYSSIQRQAEQGEKSNTIIKSWFNDGLDATNTKIVGNASNQNQVWDENGFLCRQYNPILDSYNPEQLKIINSTIAVTDNDWKSTKTAIGKFYYLDPADNYNMKTAFGINGELIVGRMLLGESLGLYNEDASMRFDKNGLVVEGGSNAFVIDPNGKSLLTAYANIGTPEEEPVLSFDNVSGELTVAGTIIANKLIVDPEATIEGLEYEKLTGAPDLDEFVTEENLGDYIQKDEVVGETPTSETTGFIVTEDGSLSASNATIYGTINASKGVIADFTIDEYGIANSLEDNDNRIAIHYEDLDVPAYVGAVGNPSYYDNYGTVRIGIADSTNEILGYRGTLPFGVNETVDYNVRGEDGEPIEELTQRNVYFTGLCGRGMYITHKTPEKEDWGNPHGNVMITDGDIETWYTATSFGRQVVSSSRLGTLYGDVQALNAECNLVCSGYVSTNERFYLPNNRSIRGAKYDTIETSYENSNAIGWVNSNNRVVLGSNENSAATEVRSPVSVYIKCGATSTDESRYTLQWAKLNLGTEAEPLMRGVLRPTYDTENGTTSSYSNLGSNQHRWRTLYITSDSVITSDRNLKKNINSVSEKYLDLFDLLNPVTYQMVDGDRIHTGFISQEVEEAMKQVGLTAEDFGGFCKDVKTKYDSETEQDIPILNENGEREYSYSLRYGEFIALNTAKIKQLEQTIKELQNEIKELKS